MNTPLNAAPKGSVHTPPGSGVPPKNEKSANAAAFEQTEIVESEPASGAWVMLTLTGAGVPMVDGEEATTRIW